MAIYCTFLATGTCNIELNSNKKEYTVQVKELEINGLPAKSRDLSDGTQVIWIHKNGKHFCGKITEEPQSQISEELLGAGQYFNDSHVNFEIYLTEPSAVGGSVLNPISSAHSLHDDQ